MTTARNTKLQTITSRFGLLAKSKKSLFKAGVRTGFTPALVHNLYICIYVYLLCTCYRRLHR